MASESPAIRHAYLVRWVVGRHFQWLTRCGYDLEDLIQEGYYAVLQAAPLYDPLKGRESTYYVRAVRHWIINRIAMPMTREKRRANLNPLSLDVMVTVDVMSGAEVRFGDILVDPAPSVEETVSRKMILRQALKWLNTVSPQQAKAVQLRYLRDMPLRSMAKVIGRSHQNAADLALRGLRSLREYMTKGGMTA